MMYMHCTMNDTLYLYCCCKVVMLVAGETHGKRCDDRSMDTKWGCVNVPV